MNGIAQTKGLFKELQPMFLEIKGLERSLRLVTADLTEEELTEWRGEIESIKSMITYSTKMDHLGHCKNRISDLLLKVLAERRNMKNIIFSL